jgi:hypothetical protein
MIDLFEIKKQAVATPEIWSCFGSPQYFESLPQVHQDQIFFLDPNASKLVSQFLSNSRMINAYGRSKYHPSTWQPFSKAYFKSIKKLILLSNERKVKKWLFNCQIPFKREVFLITDSENVILTTWKIVVKYSDLIFTDGYAIVFDESINWCLYNEGKQLYFGRDNMLLQSSRSKSFTVLDSFYLPKIGMLAIIDTGNVTLKENDMLFSIPDALEWLVKNEYNIPDNSLTSFLLANDYIKSGEKLYLISPINGKHKPIKGEILFLKCNQN